MRAASASNMGDVYHRVEPARSVESGGGTCARAWPRPGSRRPNVGISPPTRGSRSGPALRRFRVGMSGLAEIAQPFGDQPCRGGLQPLLERGKERVAVLARLDRVEDLDADLAGEAQE